MEYVRINNAAPKSNTHTQASTPCLQHDKAEAAIICKLNAQRTNAKAKSYHFDSLFAKWLTHNILDKTSSGTILQLSSS